MKYLRGINTEVNIDSAKVILFRLAKDNFAPALRTIGTMYSTGVGLSQNFHKAYIAYYKGLGVEQNHKTALHYFYKGAKK